MQQIPKAHMVLRFVTDDGSEFEAVLPNVALTIEPEIESGPSYDDGFVRYSSPGILTRLKISGYAYRGKDQEFILTMKQVKKGRNRKNLEH